MRQTVWQTFAPQLLCVLLGTFLGISLGVTAATGWSARTAFHFQMASLGLAVLIAAVLLAALLFWYATNFISDERKENRALIAQLSGPIIGALVTLFAAYVAFGGAQDQVAIQQKMFNQARAELIMVRIQALEDLAFRARGLNELAERLADNWEERDTMLDKDKLRAVFAPLLDEIRKEHANVLIANQRLPAGRVQTSVRNFRMSVLHFAGVVHDQIENLGEPAAINEDEALPPRDIEAQARAVRRVFAEVDRQIRQARQILYSRYRSLGPPEPF